MIFYLIQMLIHQFYCHLFSLKKMSFINFFLAKDLVNSIYHLIKLKLSMGQKVDLQPSTVLHLLSSDESLDTP